MFDYSILPDKNPNNDKYSMLPDKPSPLEDVYKQTKGMNPVEAANVISTALKLNADPVAVQKNFKGAQEYLNSPSQNFWKSLEEKHPITAQFISDPKNMATAKDLIPDLQRHENIFQWAGRQISTGWNFLTKGWKSGSLNVEQAELGWNQLLNTLTTGKRSFYGEDRLKQIEGDMDKLDRPGGLAPTFFVGEQLPNYLLMLKKSGERGLVGAGTWATGAAIAGQLGPQALAPEEVVTVPAASIVGYEMGSKIGMAEAGAILEGGSAFRDFIKLRDRNGKPIDPNLAAKAAMAVGIVNAGLEYAQAKMLLKIIPGGNKILDFMSKKEIQDMAKKKMTKGVFREAVKEYLKTIVEETTTEIAQQGTNIIAGEFAKGSSGQPFETIKWDQIPDASNPNGGVKQQLTGVISPTVQSVGLLGLPHLGIHAISGIKNIQQAKTDVEKYKAIGEVAANSEYMKRIPENWAKFIQMNTQGGNLENIYIDPQQFKTLLQEAAPEGINEEQKAQIPDVVAQELGIGEQLKVAQETGNPIKIPYSVWLEKMIGTPIYQAMEQHIKFSPEGMTLAQAALEDERTGKLMEEEQSRAQNLINQNEALQDGYNSVYQDIRQKLLSAGRPADIKEREWSSYVDKSARVWASRAVAESARRNISVEEWYKGANRPNILKVDFLPKDVSPEIRKNLSEDENVFLANLESQGLSIEQIQKQVEEQYNGMLTNEVEYLKSSGGQGVEQGHLVTDAEGSVVERVGRQSKNPKWYQDYFAQFGRGPKSEREFRRLATERLTNGFQDDTMPVPANQDFINLQTTLQRIKNLKDNIMQQMGNSGQRLNQDGFDNSETPKKLSLDENLQRVVTEMTPEQIKRAVYHDSLTGIYNRAAYEAMLDSDQRQPVQIMFDLNGFKNINDTLGHDAGDMVLKVIANLADQAGVGDVFRLGGDEFTVQAQTEDEARAKMEKLQNIMDKSIIEVEDTKGNIIKVSGVSFGYGYGKEIRDADAALEQHKQLQIEQGIRPKERGAKPSGLNYEGATSGNLGSNQGNTIGPETVTPARKGPVSFYQTAAWHGSPHDFEQFTTQKIGTGEGAQAYGWGMYFASNKDVAKWYQEKLANKDVSSIFIDGQSVDIDAIEKRIESDPFDVEANAIAFLSAEENNLESAIKELTKEYEKTNNEFYLQQADYLKSADIEIKKGNLYEVSLTPDESDFLDWDKHFSEQGQNVKDALIKLMDLGIYPDLKDSITNNETGESIYRLLSSKTIGVGSKERASRELNAIGIPGIRYLDGASRSKGEGNHNYVIFDDSAVNVINKYYQGEANPRAKVDISPEQSLITLFSKADASSFLHESAHIFLNDAFQFVQTGQADEKYMADWKILSDWLSVKDDQAELSREQQEQFAQGFEKYLMDGQAPSESLRKAFASFRRWLTRIYRNIRGLDVNISEPVKGVLDRMLATEDEIHAREVANDYMRDVIDENTLSPTVRKKLAELKERAHEQAIAALLKPQMDELKPEHEDFLSNERERIRKVIEEDVAKLPIYQVMEAVRMNFGQNKNIKELAARYLKNDGITDEGIARWEAVADAFGYSSGDELAKRITSAPLFADEVADRLEVHMAQFGDLKDSFEMSYEAEKAVRNDERLQALAMEKEILLDLIREEDQKQKQKEVTMERARVVAQAARRYARNILELKPYREGMAATAYFAAERQAAVREAGAMSRGEKVEAAKYAEQRVLNHALAMEALKIKEETEKIFRSFRRFQNRGTKLLNMPTEFVHQIDAVLERFGLVEDRGAVNDPEREPLSVFVKRMEEDYHVVPIPDSMLNEAVRKDYKDLSLGELRDLYDTVQSLSNLGAKQNRFYSAFIKAELLDAAQETRASIEANVGTPYEKNKGIGSHKGNLEKLIEIPDNVSAALCKPEFICRFLDGKKENGPMQRYFLNLFNRAWAEERKLEGEVVAGFRELIGKYYTEKEMAEMSKGRSKVYIEAIGKSLTKEEIILTALNWGNDGNRDRIKRGFELTDDQVEAILDNLTEKDWNLVQDTWGFIDQFWPRIKELEEKVSGVEPKKIEPLEVKTKYGVFRGGYFPIKYDAEKSSQAFKHDEELNALYKEAPSFHAATRHGHTNQRVSSLSRPISLKWSTLTGHLVNITHDLTHREAVIDASRFLRQKDVRESIENALGVKGYRALENSVKSIASDQGESRDFTDTLARWLRNKTTLSAMGLNLRVSLLQLTDFTKSAWELGAVPTARAIGNFITNPAGHWEFAKSKSEFMKERAALVDRDIYDFSRRMFQGDNKMQRFAFSIIGFMDQMVSVPVWNEAYKMGMAKFEGDETQAIEYADGIVRRTQGSGAVKDLSAFQRGNEGKKLLSMFYSFGNVLYNRYWLDFKTAGVQWEHGEKAHSVETVARAVFYGWVLPGVVEAMIREGLRNSGRDDDDEDKWKRFMLNMAGGPLQTIPIVRDVGAYLLNKAVGSGFGGYKMSPIESSVETFGKAVENAGKAARGEKDPSSALEPIVEAAALAKGVPHQLTTWAWNFLDWINQQDEASWKDIFTRRP